MFSQRLADERSRGDSASSELSEASRRVEALGAELREMRERCDLAQTQAAAASSSHAGTVSEEAIQQQITEAVRAAEDLLNLQHEESVKSVRNAADQDREQLEKKVLILHRMPFKSLTWYVLYRLLS